MKKAVISVVALLAALVLTAGGIYARDRLVRNAALNPDHAANFAYVDAGITADQAELLETEFEYEHGRYVCELKFITEGSLYDYKLDAESGQILEKKVKKLAAWSNEAVAVADEKGIPLEDVPAVGAQSKAEKPSITPAQESTTADKEKDASVKDSSVTSAASSSAQQAAEQAAAQAAAEKAAQEAAAKAAAEKAAAEKAAQEAAARAAAEKAAAEAAAKAAAEKAAAEKAAAEKAAAEAAAKAAAQKAAQPSTISVDQAKSIALGHAGIGGANFIKAKLEHDDGRLIYDIEFVSGNTEYDYEIDATNGGIIEFDIDRDDD